jgi:hypothetical protein
MGPIQSAARCEYVADTQLRAHPLGRAALDEKGAKKMRKIIGTIGATLVVAAAVAASAAPASAGFHSSHSGGANFSMDDGSVRFISYSTSSIPTWHAVPTRAGGEALSSDY